MGRMIVVIEGTLAEVCTASRASRGISHNAIVGTLTAWTLRFRPFVFAGSVEPQQTLRSEFSPRRSVTLNA